MGIPFVARRFDLVGTTEARTLFVASAAIAVVVAGTGLFNGQTFEPYTMPRYPGLLLAGENPYSTLLLFHFTECAGPTAQGWIACTNHVSRTYYVYLPLLLFAQIPYLPYAATTLLAWAGVVYLVRDRPWAVVALGNPFVGLCAANGYNDFPALLPLTLAIVARDRRVRLVAEALSVGLKQFANVALFGYLVLSRRTRAAVVSLVLAAAMLAPFAILAPRAVACTVLLHETAGCTPGSGPDLLSHLNYWLWPLWVVALFPGWVIGWVDRLRRRPAGGGPPEERA